MTMQRSTPLVVAPLLLLALAASGCNYAKQALGVPLPGEPSIALRSAETRWVLIKNPRFGDVPSEPEYVWVEEDKIPTTVTTLVRGKGAIIAPPEIVAKYGAPPGGGKISPRQGMPTSSVAAAPAPAPATTTRALGTGRAPGPGQPARAANDREPAPAPGPRRGLVVYVDTTRIVVDLTAADGVRPGTLLSLRRDKIPIVHPVTGEVLGELDEEVATARVTETRAKFSVADVQSVAAGAQIQVKDQVVLK
ncbi:MAG: hypothetical protein HYS37_13350 [Candidatus Rokubacteria bacterium]|nr:hypothetical protein [Candidatus Rokubacteria bacterium]